MPYEPPTHTVERSLRATTGAKVIAGVDEVGAVRGPARHRLRSGHRTAPPPKASPTPSSSRSDDAPNLPKNCASGVTAYALGHASPEEIDDLGMTAALRLAAVRALEALPVRPDAVILDGKHDYLGAPWRVRTVIKGDQSCVAVAAASVIAKVQRDKMMAELGIDHADFAFAANAGYPSPVHKAALEERGPTPYHRLSWAYLDALPQWRHLKKARSWAEGNVPQIEGQLGFDF